MEKVRYGIIGIGNMGIVHLKHFFEGKIENGVCTAIADLNEEKLRVAREKYPADYEVFARGEDLIDNAKVDAVIVAVPHYDHPALSIRAMKRGLHVVCEKPAGVYTKQVKEMNAVAAECSTLFTMMYNQRTNPLYIKMREILASVEFGEIRRVNWIITNWFRTQFYYDSGSWRATWKGEGGGVLLNQCPHQLDLLQWICGMMPTKIRAFCHFGKWHKIETEDDVTAYMEFPNGATGSFVTTTADAPGTNRLEITTSRGRMICERDRLTVSRFTEGDLQDFLNNSPEAFVKPKAVDEVFEQCPERNTQHVGILNNFSNAILGKEKLYVDGREGINCVQLMDAMLLSTFKDKTVTLPIDDDEYWEELSRRIATSSIKEGGDKLIDNTSSFGGTK